MPGIVKGLYLETIAYFLKPEKAHPFSRTKICLSAQGKAVQHPKSDCGNRVFPFAVMDALLLDEEMLL